MHTCVMHAWGTGLLKGDITPGGFEFLHGLDLHESLLSSITPVHFSLQSQADWTQQAQGFPNVCSAPQVNSPPDAEYL